jgi:hypothetical protein
LRQRNEPTPLFLYIAEMFDRLRKSDDENYASSLSKVIISLVAMSILFGFGLATLLFRSQNHASPDAVLPALILSFAGLVAQFGMVRVLIRHMTQASD